MNTAVAITVSLAFVVLALWHFHMALSPGPGIGGAVPSKSGKPLFVPSVRATLAVGVVLLVFACLVAATAGFVSVGLSARVLSWFCYALALGLFARAVGEFTSGRPKGRFAPFGPPLMSNVRPHAEPPA